MPLEFSVAAFRFGHTMMRGLYDFNLNFNTSGKDGTFPADVNLLFTFTALSGQLGADDTLPHNWIIEWENLVDGAKGRRQGAEVRHRAASAGRATTFRSHVETGGSATPPDAGAAARSATCCAVPAADADRPGRGPAHGLPVLSAAQLKAAAISDEQRDKLTPFLADAAVVLHPGRGQAPWRQSAGPGRRHDRRGGAGGPGPAQPGLDPHVPTGSRRCPARAPGEFELTDLLRFVGVLAPRPPPAPTRSRRLTPDQDRPERTGRRRPVAQNLPADRATIRDPDRIQVGQVLVLPVDSELERRHVPPQVSTWSSVATRSPGSPHPSWATPIGGLRIFALNKAVLTNPNLIVPGTVLVLP